MKVTIPTTSTLLSDIIRTAWYDLDKLVNAFAESNAASIWFDFTDVTADIRIEIGNDFDATLAESPRLNLFSAIRVQDFNKVSLIADNVETELLIFIA